MEHNPNTTFDMEHNPNTTLDSYALMLAKLQLLSTSKSFQQIDKEEIEYLRNIILTAASSCGFDANTLTNKCNDIRFDVMQMQQSLNNITNQDYEVVMDNNFSINDLITKYRHAANQQGFVKQTLYNIGNFFKHNTMPNVQLLQDIINENLNKIADNNITSNQQLQNNKQQINEFDINYNIQKYATHHDNQVDLCLSMHRNELKNSINKLINNGNEEEFSTFALDTFKAISMTILKFGGTNSIYTDILDNIINIAQNTFGIKKSSLIYHEDLEIMHSNPRSCIHRNDLQKIKTALSITLPSLFFNNCNIDIPIHLFKKNKDEVADENQATPDEIKEAIKVCVGNVISELSAARTLILQKDKKQSQVASLLSQQPSNNQNKLEKH